MNKDRCPNCDSDLFVFPDRKYCGHCDYEVHETTDDEYYREKLYELTEERQKREIARVRRSYVLPKIDVDDLGTKVKGTDIGPLLIFYMLHVLLENDPLMFEAEMRKAAKEAGADPEQLKEFWASMARRFNE